MMLIQLIYVCILSGTVSVLLGMLYTRYLKNQQNSLTFNFAAGFILLFGLFQLLAIPAIYLELEFHVFYWIFLILALLLCVCSVVLNRKRFRQFGREILLRFRKIPFALLIAVLIMLLQMFVYYRYMHIDDDDAFYVATAVTTVESDSMFQVDPYTGNDYKSFPMRYVLSPFPVFEAFLGKLFGIHPTVMAHTILPVLLVALAFCVTFLIGKKIFEDDLKKAGCFVIIVQAVQMFSGFNVYQQGMFFLVRIWQGKAVLAAVLIPFCIYMAMRLNREKREKADWILLLTLMFACSLVSSMGIMLGAVCTGALGIVTALHQKKLRLLIYMCCCCIPNVIYALIYILTG